jgi:uncharacterized membrane protein YhaH (DUF805 family)
MTDFNNPYAPPAATVADILPDDGEEFQPVNIFSTKGRLGRLRYITYLTGVNVALTLLGMLINATMADSIGGAGISTLLALNAFRALLWLSLQIILGIQRCHDINMSGWGSLLTLIPLVGLIWAAIPGTLGRNRFGSPPPPNSTAITVFAAISFILIAWGIVSVIAAIATYASRLH